MQHKQYRINSSNHIHQRLKMMREDINQQVQKIQSPKGWQNVDAIRYDAPVLVFYSE